MIDEALNGDEDDAILDAIANNPLVKNARWGDAIQAEVSTSKLIPEIKKSVEEAKQRFYEAFLDAGSDDDRREIQLLARSYNTVGLLIDNLEKRANEAVETLERVEDLDTLAEERPD